ncbi:MAG: ATP-binding protein [Thermoproteus sp.]
MDVFNPWWRGRLEEDPHIAKWLEQPVRWIPDIVRQIDLTPFSLHFIYGPRQVGKTTALKLLIRRLVVEEGRDPRSIFYYSCDMLSDYRELGEVLQEVIRLKRAWRVGSAVVILDEVTYPREWYRALKYFVDLGHFKNDVVIATGSVSMYAKREVEAFPGRRGDGRDYVLYPISFRKFVEVAGAGADYEAWRTRLEELLELYLQCGGMPASAVSCLSRGSPDPSADHLFISSLSSDLARLGRNEAYAKRLLRAVISRAPSPVSLNALAKDSELSTHKTAFSYLSLLENLFILKQLYWIDPYTLAEDYRKERKIHLLDPAMYRAFAQWANAPAPGPEALLEAVVAMHLARRHRVGYWRDSREIDVVVPDLGLGIEVKWGRAGRGGKVGKIEYRELSRGDVVQFLLGLAV